MTDDDENGDTEICALASCERLPRFSDGYRDQRALPMPSTSRVRISHSYETLRLPTYSSSSFFTSAIIGQLSNLSSRDSLPARTI